MRVGLSYVHTNCYHDFVVAEAKRQTEKLKRTRINPIGKVGERNIDAKERIMKEFEKRGIDKCENPKCECGMFPAPAHKHKREWYRKPERQHLLGAYAHSIYLCQKCHDEIEVSVEKTIDIFKLLR